MAFLKPMRILLLCLLTGCVVPLKVPAIKPGTENAPQINFTQLQEFAIAAGNAYASDNEIEQAYGKNNVVIRTLPHSDGKYFILFNHKNKTQTVSVRGTANKANAWVDLDSIKVYDAHLKIFLHWGFKKAADELYADATPFLEKTYKTRIVGHSLGGAMACILMMDLMQDGVPVDQVLTFGQPKVTNEQGGQAFANPLYFRIINDQDAVPQVPPSNVIYDLAGTYEHFGPEIVLLADKKWTYSPVHIPRDYVTNDNWKTLALQNGTDHQIKNYIQRLDDLK